MQDEMPLIYSLMDVFVLPSHREGFPRSLMEATAMEIPCIATNIRGCREVILDGENGVLVPFRDPESLANEISALLKDPAKAKRMGKAGREIALERFNENDVFQKVLEAYQDLIRKKNGIRGIS
jgi:glycosyltransferase involved in cell wall biosynthesis